MKPPTGVTEQQKSEYHSSNQIRGTQLGVLGHTKVAKGTIYFLFFQF